MAPQAASPRTTQVVSPSDVWDKHGHNRSYLSGKVEENEPHVSDLWCAPDPMPLSAAGRESLWLTPGAVGNADEAAHLNPARVPLRGTKTNPPLPPPPGFVLGGFHDEPSNERGLAQ